MHRNLFMLALVPAAVLGGSGAAFAHAQLKTATPSAGSTVQTAPTEVTIDYSEGLEPRFSTIEVRDASGARVDAGDVHTAPGNGKRLVVGLKPLQPGTYTVSWQAMAADTHKVKGTYKFTVGR